MRARILYHHSLPKAGNTPEENEDAYNIADDQSVISLSDGASESMYAREWAQALCDYSTLHPHQKLSPELLRRSGQFFQPMQGETPWYVESKMQQTGAAATLLRIRVRRRSFSSRVEAEAVGDSCVSLFQKGQLIWSWPLDKAEDFDSSPPLVYSLPERRCKLQSRRVPLPRGESYLVLATDALAQLFTQGVIPDIPVLATLPAFTDWVTIQRNQGLLKNDDTTIIVVAIMM